MINNPAYKYSVNTDAEGVKQFNVIDDNGNSLTLTLDKNDALEVISLLMPHEDIPFNPLTDRMH